MTTGIAVLEMISDLQQKDSEIQSLVAERKTLLEDNERLRKTVAGLTAGIEELEEREERRELMQQALRRLLTEVAYGAPKKNEVRDVIRENMEFAEKYARVRKFLDNLVLDSRDGDRRDKLLRSLDQ
jgi:hypothetical protein